MMITIFQNIERDYGIPFGELTGKFGVPYLHLRPERKEGSCKFITREGTPCRLKAKCDGLCHKHDKSAAKLKELETLFKKRFAEDSDARSDQISLDRLTLS